MDKNWITNGQFLHNLNGWVSSLASYSAGDGDDHYGVAVLAQGGYIQQSFGVEGIRSFSLHTAIKPIGGAATTTSVQLIITDGAGNTVVTTNLTASSDTWTELTGTYGLAEGTSYTIKIINNTIAGGVRIDDIWLWFVPTSRADIAARVHSKLGRLATERSLSTTASGALTEGSYTYAIDAALRSVGAINTESGAVDVRWLDSQSAQTAIDYAEREMLEYLQRDYSVEVDSSIGSRSESLSQKAKVIGDLLGTGGGSGSGTSAPVVVRALKHD